MANVPKYNYSLPLEVQIGARDLALSLVSEFPSHRKAKLLRDLLQEYGLSQSRAARDLNISDRNMRRYLAAELPIPQTIAFAVVFLIMVMGHKQQ
jgi:hypothetical protein